MGEIRWIVEYRANGEREFRRNSVGFRDEKTARDVALQSAKKSPEIGVRVVKEVRTVVWTARRED